MHAGSGIPNTTTSLVKLVSPKNETKTEVTRITDGDVRSR